MGEGIGRLIVNANREVQITLSGAMNPHLVEEAVELLKKHSGFCRTSFGKPFKKRSTGYRSQNSHFYGHATDLAEQEENPYLRSKDMMVWCLLCKSIDRGLPSDTVNGIRVPKPTSLHDSFESNITIATAHQHADENNRWLREYHIDGRVYKSLGGLTLKEMMIHYPEYNPEFKDEKL